VHPDGRFELVGRDADLLDIAGKRASLGDLNCKLLAIPGVHDGVFLAPEDAAPHAHPPRLGALVVAPKLSREALVSALRKCVDPAFLPRRVVFLERLPRDATGKLRRSALMECWNRRDAARRE
jgi:acyl-coenzyme A synthetase/AMP-(fatty) acid ligase